ncbi:MAG: GAF domain-containing protein [Chloroflexi bacterium]|nr:GAF domain-containing protein [Chloroflexota bacterium]
MQTLRQQVTAFREPEQQRQQAEQALRESEEKYRAILENIEEAYYEMDLAGSFTFFNDALCRVLGYTRDELMGMNYRQYMDEETAEKAYYTFNTVYRTGEFAKIVDWEIIKKGRGVTTKDGARRAVAASVSLMTDLVGGEPIGFRGIVRDVTERRQVEDEIVKLNRELTALNSIGQALISVLDVQETLTVITDRVINLMGVEAASVVLRDTAKGDLWFAAASGQGAEFVQSVRLPLGQGVAGWVVQNGEPVMVSDVSKDTRWFSDLDEQSGLAISSILCVPMQTKGQTIGAIEAMNKKSGTFDEADLRFLTSIAAPAATAIENARLFEQSRIHADELAVLNELGQALTARLDVEEVLEAAYQGAARLVDTTNFYIGLYDAEQDVVTVPFVVSESEIDRQITVIPADQGFAGYIIRNRTSVLVEENVLGWLAERGIEPVGDTACSWLGVPLIVGDQVLGVMAVQSYTTPRLYDEHDRDLLAGIASQAAIAIQNARLYEQAQHEISERKRAERALGVEKAHLDQLFGSVPEAIVLVDNDSRVLRINDEFTRMFGYTIDEVLSQSIDELLAPDALIEKARAITKRVAGGDRTVFEAKRQHKDGTFVDVSILGTTVLVDGEQTAVYAVYRNITERKRAAESLQQAHDELEKYTTILERQTARLQVGSEVAREVSAILDVRQLLDETVHLISEKFDLYHAGVFMVGEPGEYAILRATSSEGGRRMLERGYRLPVGRDSAVGYVATTGEHRIVLDVGEDAASFDIPDLPGTRSEICLPLRAGGRIIGVLDIQSTLEAAFSEDDVPGFQALADQLAVSIENARLVERTESQLRETERLYGEYSAAAWADLLSPGRPLGYIYDRVDVLPATESPVPGLALERGGPGTRGATLAVPLKVRGQTIGVLGVQEGDGAREWSPEEVAIVEAVSDQVAMALDSARLFGETRTRAEELAVLNELAQSLAASLTVEEVLEETYRGVSQLLDATNFYVGLYDSQKDEISFPLDVTESVEDQQITVIPADQGYAGYIVRNRTSLLVAEDTVEEVLEKTTGSGIEGVGQMALSYLGVPLLIGDRVLGVIAVQDYATPHVYDARDQSLLTAIASQAAIAIQSANLFEEVQRRAVQLAAAAEVARDATAILEVDQLLDETVHLISEQFGYYHAGVFLLDEQDEYAVLQAASSEGGQRMLERGHKLKVGEVGIVGYTAATGEPRVALDVGLDATHFAHGDLPNTRSELGLPLKVRDRVIGVLDVQSEQAAAFSEDDVSALQTMADQLATAIVNARLFQEVRADAHRRALISEMLQAAATSLEPEELLHRAGEIISQRLGVPSAVFIWNSKDRDLRPIAIHDSAAADVSPPGGFQRIPREVDVTLFDTVEERRTHILETIGDANGALTIMAGGDRVQSAIYVPLVSRDQVLGVLVIGGLEGQPLVDVEFIELVAANLSVAWENAWLYQEAVRVAERLAEVDRLKSQFLANMSHELRTPLNSIIGFSRVILKEIDGPITDMQRTDLQAVYDSGQHLLGLINDILEVSKIESGKMELVFEPVNLRDIIRGVMATAIALVKDKPDVELQQIVPENLPMINGDTRRIRQAVLNLVANATKFTKKGFIRVEVSTVDTEVIIAVVDSGIGILQDQIDMIFEPFTQADSSTTREAGGTGLGLSITNSFVEMHGGRMWVESELGKGSTFYIALPIAGPPLPEEEVEGRYPETEKVGQKVILCVEDDEGVITLFRRYLSRKGYQVVGLTNSSIAVERARELKPYAITLDVMMPGKDGWQVIQELKSNPETRGIPVVMCTIVGEEKYGLTLGAADYLLKPILEHDLLSALNRLDREDGHHLVLVVDDQPEDRNLLRRMLEAQEGYEVIEAGGGEEAIALIQQRPPHVIILDLMMPNVDGFTVLEAVKTDKNTRSIPIIVVTAKELTQDERETLTSGAEALLQKGIFEQQELLADVAEALERLERN